MGFEEKDCKWEHSSFIEFVIFIWRRKVYKSDISDKLTGIFNLAAEPAYFERNLLKKKWSYFSDFLLVNFIHIEKEK